MDNKFMRYLKIAVFVFIVGCSNLTEEKVYTERLDWVVQNVEVSTKYIESSLRYKFTVEQTAACNHSENMNRWIIYFRDKDGFDVADTSVYRDRDITLIASDDCTVTAQGIVTMKPNTYKQITGISVVTNEK